VDLKKLTMDQKFTDKAASELGETEVKRTQSLAQFREWLSKHPFLSEARQGAHFS
jgi:hypothetical protein